MRARGIAEEEARRQVERLNELMMRRMRRELSVGKRLRELEEDRLYRNSVREERRSAARTRVSQRNLELERESVRSYEESVRSNGKGRKAQGSR